MKRIKYYMTAAVIAIIAIACSKGCEPVEWIETNSFGLTPLGIYTGVDMVSVDYAKVVDYEPVKCLEAKGHGFTPLGSYTGVDLASIDYAKVVDESLGEAGSKIIFDDAKVETIALLSSNSSAPLHYYTTIE
ncbi:hypothetical protein SAMN02745751_03225 [Dethiosulfatibacter aminovorans DSM 17477]|uniref:Uncharacterized protein n=1 Tax=Dethiosulfatibacter aminovorans DSM 17477 TaxID=1121476 RepID=A0A1M6LND1_9FIRM|nr:hypothetical protein [Dethiosulfatibacter aminovorans]SHJ72653.1 hypothetical protein SAMN02745751_03225 [Dethiosulfatibacter aminovorans DSM 17477]